MKVQKNIKLIKQLEVLRRQTICQEELLEPKICNVPSLLGSVEYFEIPQCILHAYFCKVPRTENFYDWNGVHFPSVYDQPFDISVYGAYPIMNGWRELQETMKVAYNEGEHDKFIGNASKKDYRYETIDFRQYKKEKVLVRLKSFAEGFKYGYDSFIDTQINSENAISNSDMFKVQRIIDFLNRKSWPNISFQIISIRDNEQERLQKWYNDGVIAGSDYRAWCFIFTNHKLFEPYFESLQKSNSNIDDTLDLAPNSFELLANVVTNLCCTVLKNNKFIKKETKVKDFDRIFSGEKIINKIDWVGTLPELSRFAFLLHHDYENKKNKSVCKLNKKWHLIACKCFSFKGKEINSETIQNNNRKLKDNERLNYLLNAIKSLKAPVPSVKK